MSLNETLQKHYSTYTSEHFHLLAASDVRPQLAEEEVDQHVLVLHRSTSPVKIQENIAGHIYRGQAFQGDLNFIPSRVDNSCEWGADLSFLRLELSADKVKQIAEQENRSPNLSYNIRTKDEKLIQLMTWLEAEGKNGFPQGQLYTDSMMNLITLHLLNEYGSRRPDDLDWKMPSSTVFSTAVEYMHAHYDQDITLEELHQLSHLSSSHFITSFKKEMGITPHQYLLKIRIDRAKELLLDPVLTIGDISLRLGFSDQSHFHRHFKKWTGVTPLQWKKNFVQK
ncbi:AraC family transcriptional regulator [Priestia koreensis]|uniref:helix-turn-helix transcriptional regulator n=1 Tax=Priestia koreensis TaxID=284581 RepID=UPI0028F6F326|nr:AraC family transcriptional regulator [Priestia koreensis]